MEAQTKIKQIKLSLVVARILYPNMMYNPMLAMQSNFAAKIMDKMLKKK